MHFRVGGPDTPPRDHLCPAAHSAEPIIRLRNNLWSCAQESHETRTGRFSGALAKELSSRFHYSHLFCDRNGDPLVQ